MLKWNATMPRERAKAGQANVVLAFRKAKGIRMEFVGELSEADAQSLLMQAIEMMKTREVLPVAAAPEQKP